MSALVPEPASFGLEADSVVAVPASGQIVFRITQDQRPAVTDFMSNRDKRNRQMRGESWLIYNGLSVFAEQGQAEALRDRLKPGQHVSPVPLPGGLGVALARTRRTEGHHTIWGRPEILLRLALDQQGYPVDKEFR